MIIVSSQIFTLLLANLLEIWLHSNVKTTEAASKRLALIKHWFFRVQLSKIRDRFSLFKDFYSIIIALGSLTSGPLPGQNIVQLFAVVITAVVIAADVVLHLFLRREV